MRSQVLPLPASGFAADQLEFISLRLLRGAILVYPTETFYGLGGLAQPGSAAGRIFELKGRELANPLPFVASDLEMVLRFSDKPADLFFRLAEHFWPGPLTLVIRAREHSLPKILYGPGQTIAVRVPPLSWLRELIRKSGSLLISTSANLSGQTPLASFPEVYEIFRDRVDLFIDGGPTPGGQPSTIIDLTSSKPICLREGKIPAAEVWSYLYER